MTHVPKRVLSIERLEEQPRLPNVEIQVAADTVLVTLDLPDLDHVDVVVTRTSLELGSKQPGGRRYMVPLPVNVEPGRHIVRSLNGVVDVHLARATRSH